MGKNTNWKLGLDGKRKSYLITNLKSYLDGSSVGMHSIRLYFVSNITHNYTFRLVSSQSEVSSRHFLYYFVH